MDAAAWEKKYDQLFELARKTRHHQRQYLEFHSSADLDKARYYQRKLDDVITEEVKRRKSKQQTLF